METSQALGANPTLVIFTSWILTFALGKLFKEKGADRLRALLPTVALLTAVAVEVIWSSVQGQDLSWSLILKAVGEAGTAVIAHSQFREFMKGNLAPKPQAETLEAVHEDPHEDPLSRS